MATSFSLVAVFFFCIILRQGTIVDKVGERLTKADLASVRRRRALRAARRTTPLAAGRRHSLPRTKLVRVVSRPPTTTPGST